MRIGCRAEIDPDYNSLFYLALFVIVVESSSSSLLCVMPSRTVVVVECNAFHHAFHENVGLQYHIAIGNLNEYSINKVPLTTEYALEV